VSGWKSEDRDTVAAVREEAEWPLDRTRWQRLYLAGAGVLATEAPHTQGLVSFKTRSRAAAFSWTVREDTELTGPMAAADLAGPVRLRGCEFVRRR
jgi:predicted acyl esterase